MGNQPDFSLYVAVFAGLAFFVVLYNSFLGWMSNHKYHEGFTSLLVIVGVVVTVGGCGFLIGWQAMGTLLLGFVASGTPMVVGELGRYVVRRSKAQKALRDE